MEIAATLAAIGLVLVGVLVAVQVLFSSTLVAETAEDRVSGSPALVAALAGVSVVAAAASVAVSAWLVRAVLLLAAAAAAAFGVIALDW